MSRGDEKSSKSSHLSSQNLLASLAYMTIELLMQAGLTTVLELKAVQGPQVLRFPVMTGDLHLMHQQMGPWVIPTPLVGQAVPMVAAKDTSHSRMVMLEDPALILTAAVLPTDCLLPHLRAAAALHFIGNGQAGVRFDLLCLACN